MVQWFVERSTFRKHTSKTRDLTQVWRIYALRKVHIRATAKRTCHVLPFHITPLNDLQESIFSGGIFTSDKYLLPIFPLVITVFVHKNSRKPFWDSLYNILAAFWRRKMANTRAIHTPQRRLCLIIAIDLLLFD